MAVRKKNNSCNVKYIHLDAVDPAEFHTAKDFEMHVACIEHSTYQELHEAVFKACPVGFTCKEPLALFHEVLWSTGIRVTKSTGENERVRLERDELHHAIEEGEYCVLWGEGKRAAKMISICVDIDATAAAAEETFVSFM